MGQETKRPATYADLEALPEDVVGQLIDGRLIATPRPANPHGNAQVTLVGELYARFQRGHGGPGGWRFMSEPELHLGGNVLVPDIAAWSAERLSPRALRARFFTQAPDWVCEIPSPSTQRLDRGRKSELYAREGVGQLWLVDPEERTLEVLQRVDDRWLPRGRYAGVQQVRVEPFESLLLDLGALWPPELDAP
ncbi:Uma2 family endonuclease [Myxococcus sp. K15C18031901]|uniref:Uma2 family endonuclease n=1 Tax=Myxococcus dinghuensis TaxID=2906761 RepID=UPI0020A74361|nr:Uma2 family endonuclease [Myxococcus dinghuensis]MCP3098115.1 Uma2 family endonuclease [Myxococcus dinghuensis]